MPAPAFVFSSAHNFSMGGFFIESVITSFVTKIRADSRVSKAEEWPLVDRKISRLTFSKRGTLIRTGLSYSYDVNGETHYGSAACHEIREELEDEARESTERLDMLRVRCNPSDPMESRLLNEDNPKLRLKIGHVPD